MSICPSCRNALPATSPFCPICGADQSLVPPADADLTIAPPVDDFTMTSVLSAMIVLAVYAAWAAVGTGREQT